MTDETQTKRPLQDDEEGTPAKKAKTAGKPTKRVKFDEEVQEQIIPRVKQQRHSNFVVLGSSESTDFAVGTRDTTKLDEEGREMVGDRKNYHTLDSDEEDEADDVAAMDHGMINGQEKKTIEFDGDIKIMPFNMNEDMEDGHFDSAGNFLFDKKTEEMKDPWFDSVDWNKIAANGEEPEAVDEQSDEEDESMDSSAVQMDVYKELVVLLKDGETPNKALKRIQSTRPSPADERKLRFAAKKVGKPYVDESVALVEKMTTLTDSAMNAGLDNIYDVTKEEMQSKMDEAVQQGKAAANDDGDDADTIMWEYKNAGASDDTVQKASTKHMMEMRENGTIADDVEVRREGSDAFYSASRIDFEIYL